MLTILEEDLNQILLTISRLIIIKIIILNWNISKIVSVDMFRIFKEIGLILKNSLNQDFILRPNWQINDQIQKKS
jgi:hypothetical protein